MKVMVFNRVRNYNQNLTVPTIEKVYSNEEDAENNLGVDNFGSYINGFEIQRKF